MKRFPNGSRVCFIGDSLVNHNFTLSWIIDCYQNNFPDEDIRFFNCGTAGSTAEFALKTFEDDTMLFKPTHVVIALGINDSRRWCLGEQKSIERYNILKQSFEEYKQNITELCDKVIENNIELILCTPAPYDEYEPTDQKPFKGGYALMSEYANFIRNFAIQNNYTLCDYYEKMVKIMQTDKLYNTDHVHPTEHGYFRMAEIFLNEQGLKISKESDITQKFSTWRTATKIYRDIYIAECMVIQKPDLPVKEKLQIASIYIAENKDKPDNGRTKWYISLCEGYLKNRENIKELAKELEHIYEKEILHK